MQLFTLSHIYSSSEKAFKMKIINPSQFKKLPDGFLFDTDNTLYHMSRHIILHGMKPKKSPHNTIN